MHWSQVSRVLKQAGDLFGKTIISCSLPMNASDTKLVVADTTSGAETLEKKALGAKIVSAFSTVPSEALKGVFRRRHRRNRPNLIFCGDDWRAKKVAARLIRDVGFTPIDAGPLRIARYLEPSSLLIVQLAYETGGRPEVVYRIGPVGQPNRA